MRICRIKTKNFRTLENCSVEMPDYYAAISGKNNAGKSNLLRVVRSFFVNDDEFDPFGGEAQSLNFKSDYPIWKRKDEKIEQVEISIEIMLHKVRDAGLYKYVQSWLVKECEPEELNLTLGVNLSPDQGALPQYTLRYENEEISDSFRVQEIHKKLKTSNSFLYHNSTQPRGRYFSQQGAWSLLGSVTAEDKEKIKESKDTLFRRLNSVAARHKADIAELLGRLEEKYEVGLSIPSFDFDNFPFMLSLGDKRDNLPLDDWGSGTQNRTQIMLALLRAKKLREAGSESDRITPIIVIEEPESFLHPSAQAEFGRFLRDLAREFEVQVIATTHSPHMLSVGRPDANILLSRRVERGRVLETVVEDTTGDEWMKPFALALGVTSDSFGPWRQMIFAHADELLLVEGDIDRDYFEALRKPEHGENRLDFKGDIFPYGGDGFFSQDVMINFILKRFSRVVITFDMDVEAKVGKKLESLNLKKGEDFIVIGQNHPGKRNIEGLLPPRVTSEVASDEPELLDLANSSEAESRGAKQKIKRLKQQKFLSTAKPGTPDYDALYSVCEQLNKAFKRKRRAAGV